MARYVLVESRDPFESRDVPYFHTLATDLAAKGEQVTLFLVQNGVLAARKAARGNSLGDVLKHDVEVLVDRFSLRVVETPYVRRRSRNGAETVGPGKQGPASRERDMGEPCISSRS